MKPGIKSEIIQDLKSQAEISKKFNVSESTVSRIKKSLENSENSKNFSSDIKNLKRKRVEKVDGLSNILLTWFNRARTLKIPISYCILKEKALEIARGLGMILLKFQMVVLINGF